MKKVLSVFMSLAFFAFMCIAPEMGTQTGHTHDDHASDEYKFKDKIPFEQFKAIINRLATDKEHFAQPTLDAFGPLNKALNNKNITDYDIWQPDDKNNTITIMLHSTTQERAIHNAEKFTLDEDNSELLATVLISLQHKRSKKTHSHDHKDHNHDGDSSDDSKHKHDDDEDDDDDHHNHYHGHDHSDHDHAPVKKAPSKPASMATNKHPHKQSPNKSLRRPMHHRPHGFTPMRFNPMQQHHRHPGSMSGPTRNKTGYAQEGKIKPAKHASYQDIKSITAKGVTSIAGTSQTRVPESTTYTRKPINPSYQHFDHKRRTQRTSRLVVKDEKPKTTTPDHPVKKPAPQKSFTQRVYGLFSSLFSTIKGWFS